MRVGFILERTRVEDLLRTGERVTERGLTLSETDELTQLGNARTSTD